MIFTAANRVFRQSSEKIEDLFRSLLVKCFVKQNNPTDNAMLRLIPQNQFSIVKIIQPSKIFKP
jgi:hypothetical protein